MHLLSSCFPILLLIASCITAPAYGLEETRSKPIISTEIHSADDLPAQESVPSPPLDIWDRIRRGFQIPSLTGRRVNTQLKLYARMPHYIERVSERAGPYLFHIVEEVERRGMPTELALLPFVESAFQPEALSFARAAGLWQFMPQTGSIFSLQQNLWKDERRDVMESTRAALDYFEKLYALFGDWQLALAAYNWGEGSVMKAVKQAQARKCRPTYSNLRMPYETANYLPKLEAIKQIISKPEKYRVTLPDIENRPYFLRVTKSRDIDLDTAINLAQMDEVDFKRLNPGFNLPVIVASHNSSFLLPLDNLDRFMNNMVRWLDNGKQLSNWTLYRVQDGETLEQIAERYNMALDELKAINKLPKDRKVLAGSPLLVTADSETMSDITQEDLNAKLALTAPEWRRVVYRVRRGDTLYSIATKNGITQASIRKSSRIGSSRLRIGQRLILEIPPKKQIDYYRIHVVKPGETLGSIAKRHHISVSRVRKLNGLTSSRIQIGQHLKIR